MLTGMLSADSLPEERHSNHLAPRAASCLDGRCDNVQTPTHGRLYSRDTQLSPVSQLQGPVTWITWPISWGGGLLCSAAASSSVRAASIANGFNVSSAMELPPFRC